MHERTSYRQINGSCHCGNIHFTLDWPASGTIPVRACGCDHCKKHRGVWTSHPNGRFRSRLPINTRPRNTNLERKRRISMCKTCGIVPIVTCVIDGAAMRS